MTKLMNRSLLILICCAIYVTRAHAYDQEPAVFSTTSISIDPGANPLPLAGDTVDLVMVFKANKDATATLRINFPGVVGPPNQGVSETYRDSLFSVDSGSTYTVRFPLRLFSYGASRIEASLSTTPTYPGWLTSTSFQSLQIKN